MQENYKIIWLASYPKSGNTWFRTFLANLLFPSDKPFDINKLQYSSIASNRQLFDECSGVSSSDLTPEEIEKLRPYVYEQLASQLEADVYMKTHDAFTYTSEGIAIHPASVGRKALYFVRNPLDVAVSFAHHSAVSYDKIVEVMANENYKFCNHTHKLDNQLRQILLSWSGHVTSWVSQSVTPVKVLRYEDMILDTHNTFKQAIEYLGLKFSDAEIEKAIHFSSFSEMQKQELEGGFKEKPALAKSFFRKGKIGSWHDELPQSLANEIIKKHSVVMNQFGYLNDKGLPVF
jgi:hypothetical protein